jgi:ABC-type bacteriocin/lantibiotic exporter with double-glycine peptidase domain
MNTTSIDSLRALLPFLRPVWKRCFGLCVCITAIAALKLPSPFIMRYLIDTVIPRQSYHALMLIGASLAAIYTLNCAFHLAKGLLLVRFKERVIYDLQLHLFRHVLSLPVSFFKTHQSGYVVSRMTNEVRNVEQVLTDTAFGLLVDMATFVFGLVALLSFDVRLTLISVSVLPFYIFGQAWFGSRIKIATRDLQERVARLNGNLQESVAGIMTIKAFSRENRAALRLSRLMRGVIEGKVKITMLFYLFTGISALVGSVAPLLAIWYGAAQVMAGHLTLGTIIAFTTVLGYLFGPTTRVIELNMKIKEASASIDRIRELLSIRPEEAAATGRDICIRNGSVEFREVAFAYNGDGSVLRGVSLKVEPRQVLAIVGASGAGKTTLLNLLLRLYTPDSGVVLIDGFDAREFSLRSLRRQIALVDQNTTLFDGTIRDNIAYGCYAATDEDIIAAAKLANAHEFIMRLPSEYSTLVAERGSNLSGGERQRLAIARALLTKSPLLLLDEATSFLDSESESLIHETVANIRRRMTTIVVAHKLSTVLQADVIAVLDAGRIDALGSHDYLLAHSPRYRSLFEAQLDAVEARVV